MDMRTPLGRVRGLGSAKEGTGHFWMQRVTAVANLFLVTFFLILVVRLSSRHLRGCAGSLRQPLSLIHI